MIYKNGTRRSFISSNLFMLSYVLNFETISCFNVQSQGIC